MKRIILVIILLVTVVACTGKKTPAGPGLSGELLVSDQLIIGISPDYPPFEFLDTANNIVGFDVDLLNELIVIINEDNDLNLTISWKALDFETIVGALQAQQIDMGVSAFTYDPQRDVFFSLPYISSQQVVVVNNDSAISAIDALAGRKIGVQTGTTGEEAAKEIESAKLVSLSDATQLFAQLQTSAVDAVVIDRAVAENYVKNTDSHILPEPLVDEDMSIIIAHQNVNLQAAVDRAIEKFIRTAKYQELLKKWDIEQ